MNASTEGCTTPRHAGSHSGAAPSSSRWRLANGGAINRFAPVTFSFDGRQLSGYLGDTLASALLANGVRLVGRSFKYHRPRGILACGPEEPNALVTVNRFGVREPNSVATV